MNGYTAGCIIDMNGIFLVISKVHHEPMVRIEPIQMFFRFALWRTFKAAPSCATSPPSETRRIAMPWQYLVYRNTQAEVLRHYRNEGMPERRGRRFSEPPGAGMEFLFQIYRTFGGWYTITFF